MVYFKINQRLPSLNDYINILKSPQGKYQGNDFKRTQDKIVVYSALRRKQELKEYCKEPVLFWIEYHEKNKRRDIDNVESANKYILDGLQQAGILQNDNSKWVKGVYPSIVYGTEEFICVRIYHLDEYNELFRDYVAFERLKIEAERKRK